MSEMLKRCLDELQARKNLLDIEPKFEFAVHEHRATTHHYDFSLLIGDWYVTWAISQGPSLNPLHARRAVESGLHDPKHARSERFIPAGWKGSGPKMLWDIGSCHFEFGLYEELLQALEQGHLELRLEGKKLNGGWTLQRLAHDWTFTKHQDAYATEENVLLQDRSVHSLKRLRDFELGPAVWIELPGFYVAQHPQARPLIIVKDGLVLDANQLALERKVSPGMPDRMAKNIIGDADFLAWNPEDYYARQQEWLNLCLDYTDGIEPIEQHSAFLDFKLHPQPQEMLSKLSQNLTEKFKLTPYVGLAQAKWIAKLAAHAPIVSTAFEDPESFVASFPVTSLEPASIETRTTLKSLGCKTIGQVARMSFDELKKRFGNEVLAIRQAAHGSYIEPVKHVYPLNSISNRFNFDGAVESWETILEGCNAWSQTIGKKLQRQSDKGAKVHLFLEFEDGSSKAIRKTFSKPIKCPRSVLGALKLLLEGQIQMPLLSMRILLPELQKVKAEQHSLFEVEKQVEFIQPSLESIRKAYGIKSIELGSQREVLRKTRVLRAWKNATGWQ